MCSLAFSNKDVEQIPSWEESTLGGTCAEEEIFAFLIFFYCALKP
jgi:hypothetical protein